MMRAPLVGFVLFTTSACGGEAESGNGPKHPETPSASTAAEPGGDAAPKADAKTTPEPPDKTLPTTCDKEQDGLCIPRMSFVKMLCEKTAPDVALVMFASGTPWTRVYLTRNTEAVNASGGATVAGEIAFDEEVLVLRASPQDSGGFSVSGGGSYDALRWNGSCVTLSEEEVTRRVPPKKKHSRIEWRWLSDATQSVLRRSKQIAETDDARRKECRGVTMGTVSAACERFDKKLIDVVVEHVRSGGELPPITTLE